METPAAWTVPVCRGGMYDVVHGFPAYRLVRAERLSNFRARRLSGMVITR